MRNDELHALMVCTRSGDLEAFSKIVEHFQRPLSRYLLHLVGPTGGTNLTLSLPASLPAGAALERVQILSVNLEWIRWWEVHQLYRLASNAGGSDSEEGVASLEFVQVYDSSGAGAFGPSDPGFRDTAQRFVVGQQEIYAIQRFGLWMLVWKPAEMIGDSGFVLSAPSAAMSLDELLQIAGSVVPVNR